jgi:large subunit ribosomal protein L18
MPRVLRGEDKTMIKKETRKDVREKKHLKLRNRYSGTAERPRLAVYRSNNHIYAQIIDDTVGKTLVSAGTVEKDIVAELKNTDDVDAAAKIGEIIAKRAADKGITKVVFDRGGFIYQGKIAALAEAARKGGLEF